MATIIITPFHNAYYYSPIYYCRFQINKYTGRHFATALLARDTPQRRAIRRAPFPPHSQFRRLGFIRNSIIPLAIRFKFYAAGFIRFHFRDCRQLPPGALLHAIATALLSPHSAIHIYHQFPPGFWPPPPLHLLHHQLHSPATGHCFALFILLNSAASFARLQFAIILLPVTFAIVYSPRSQPLPLARLRLQRRSPRHRHYNFHAGIFYFLTGRPAGPGPGPGIQFVSAWGFHASHNSAFRSPLRVIITGIVIVRHGQCARRAFANYFTNLRCFIAAAFHCSSAIQFYFILICAFAIPAGGR